MKQRDGLHRGEEQLKAVDTEIEKPAKLTKENIAGGSSPGSSLGHLRSS